VLTLVRDGEEMLPAFSHEEEAEMFLRLLRGAVEGTEGNCKYEAR